MHFTTPGRHVLTVAVLLLALNTLGGCAIVNHLLYVVRGATVPAEFDGLKGKRVAVVCVSANEDYGPDSTTEMLSKEIERQLKENVKDVTLVRHSEVANWIDRNDWKYDYLQVGRGVKAEMVVGIDVGRFSMHEGGTLYKGHADVEIQVFDMAQQGAKVYQTIIDDFSFPTSGAQAVTDISEAKFKRAFIKVLAQAISRSFYAYEIQEDVAPDRAFLSR
jgi:hypothetical protein